MPRQVSDRTGEIAIALALLLMSIAAIALAWNMPAGTPSLPGPRVFPTALAVLLAAVSLALLISAARRGGPLATIELGHVRVVVTLAALAATAVLFERIGAPASFVLLLLVLLRTLAGLQWWQAALAAVIGSAAAWAVFKLLLGVKLPALPG